MPGSIITKLTHADESTRISKPRIETLIKIVDFFRADGFDITIDDFLSLHNKSIDVQSLLPVSSKERLSIPLYSLQDAEQKMGTIEAALPNTSHALALYSENDIDPFFKSGSIFIIDLDMKPTHDTLVAVKLESSEQIHIKKYYLEKNKIILKSLNAKEKDITLMPTQGCTILGVIIQINAKT